jgi:DNA-binding NtrC family response regulator
VRGTILVVDDEEAICRLLVGFLTLRNFKVAAARNGREALALAEQENPDLIILDLAMPEMDGIETLRQIRERVGEVKVIILTGYGTVHRAREAMALGVRAFIGKPCELDRLLRLVAEEIGEAVTSEE